MTAVTRRTLTEQVAEGILDLILGDGYAVGDSLPSTSELGDRFDVSVVVVREAMATLAGRGIVVRRQGRESTVGRPDADVLDSILRVRIHQDGIDIGEFHQARAALELQATALAATAVDAGTRAAALEPALSGLREETSTEAVAEADRQFHLALAELSGNQVIRLLLTSLSSVLRDAVEDSFRRLVERYGDEGPGLNVCIHQRIADAVVAGDRAGAIEAMADHFLFWGDDFDFGSVGHTARGRARRRPRP
jgi:GntR family transcriptional repressor for pyruvate dehydrogenase complex